MLIYLYFGVLMLGGYLAIKMLAPEMKKPAPAGAVPVARPRNTVQTTQTAQTDQPVNRIEKLEMLLTEKNKNILLLQTELKSFYAQIRDFDKVKVMLEEEVHRLREQNRIFRSELGLPATQPKENSVA